MNSIAINLAGRSLNWKAIKRRFKIIYSYVDLVFEGLFAVFVFGLILFCLLAALDDWWRIGLAEEYLLYPAFALSIWWVKIFLGERLAEIRQQHQQECLPAQPAADIPPGFEDCSAHLPPDAQQQLLAETNLINSIADGVLHGKTVEWDMDKHREAAARALGQPVLPKPERVLPPTIFARPQKSDTPSCHLEQKFDQAMQDLERDLSSLVR